MKHPLQQLAEQPGEERVLIIRRHWLVLGRRGLLILFLGLLPVILWLFFGTTINIEVTERTVAGALLVLGVSLWYLYLCVFLLNTWVDYALDVWIVSTRRIVNIEQRGLFSRVVSELFLDKVQDVTVEVHGVLPTMMHFGDILIQSAGENPRFHFDDVPNPTVVAERIMELHRTYVREERGGQETASLETSGDDSTTTKRPS